MTVRSNGLGKDSSVERRREKLHLRHQECKIKKKKPEAETGEKNEKGKKNHLVERRLGSDSEKPRQESEFPFQVMKVLSVQQWFHLLKDRIVI